MKPSLVNQRLYHTEALGEEECSVCTCCGRPAVEGEGALASSDSIIALYGYRWSEGHESRFTLGISPLGEDGDPPLGLAVVACRSDGEQLMHRPRADCARLLQSRRFQPRVGYERHERSGDEA